MPVYFIQAGDDGPVKIGTAKDVLRRLSMLKTSSAEPLHLRALYEGGAAEESLLHRRFAAHRIRREWFNPDVLAEAVDLPVAPAPQPRERKGWTDQSVRSMQAKRALHQHDPERIARRREGYKTAAAIVSIRAACWNISRFIAEAKADPGGRYHKRNLSEQLARLQVAFQRCPDAWERIRGRSDGDHVGRGVRNAAREVCEAIDAYFAGRSAEAGGAS